MKGVALVRACALLPIVDHLRALGASPALVFERAGLPGASVEDPEALLPLHQAAALLAEASSAQGCTHLALQAGERISLAALGDFGRALLHQPSLGAALDTAVRLYPLYSSGGSLRLIHEGNRTWLRHRLDRRLRIGRDQAEQWTLMLVVQFVRLAAEPGWRPLEIELCAKSSPGTGGVGVLRGTRIHCGHPSTGIAVPRSLLGRRLRPLPAASPSFEELEQRLAASAPAADFEGSIQQVVRALLRDGYPCVAHSAGAIGMSVRTLQRRLGEGGTSYSGLVDRERFALALRLLAGSPASVTDVAIRLGYADLANFSHAFRRWTGIPPTQFRREVAQAVPSRDAAQTGRVISNTIKSGRGRFQRQRSPSPCWLAMQLIQPSVVQQRSSG